MSHGRCPVNCGGRYTLSRRDFLAASAAMVGTSSILSGCRSLSQNHGTIPLISPQGPASKYTPVVRAAFVRRSSVYGNRWPGAVYDGEAARKKYTKQLRKAAKAAGVKLKLRSRPIYEFEEADAWAAQARAAKTDGIVVMLLDRQRHSWYTAKKAVDTGIPTVIFSPVGTCFTTNTSRLAETPGCAIYSGEDFTQAAFGVKMLAAGTRMQKCRCLVIKGDERIDRTLKDVGITLHHVPGHIFLEKYRNSPTTDGVVSMAEEYISKAGKIKGATRQDVINGAKFYFTASEMLKSEQCDAITMDCLGLIAKKENQVTDVSLPCLSWSRMNDDGLPAICETDTGAVASQVMVQYLFDRPGFQQDPVPDTLNDAIIGAHCSCPTKLNGFDKPSEPFNIVHHHGLRDATPMVFWKKGQRVTSVDVVPEDKGEHTKVLVSSGTVMGNVSVPPNGGCVISVRVKFDGDQPVLTFPGFHQIFFYGDYKKEVINFCRLFKLDYRVV